jgi:hypothetical protein
MSAPEVEPRHLQGLLGTAGKSLAAMPDGKRIVERLRDADSRDDLLFILRSADLGVDPPAREVIQDEARRSWQGVKATLLQSAELQLHERYDSNA